MKVSEGWGELLITGAFGHGSFVDMARVCKGVPYLLGALLLGPGSLVRHLPLSFGWCRNLGSTGLSIPCLTKLPVAFLQRYYCLHFVVTRSPSSIQRVLLAVE